MVAVIITHAPADYECPFCALATGADTDRQQDIVRRTAKPHPEFVTAEQRRPYAEKLRRYFAAPGSAAPSAR